MEECKRMQPITCGMCATHFYVAMFLFSSRRCTMRFILRTAQGDCEINLRPDAARDVVSLAVFVMRQKQRIQFDQVTLQLIKWPIKLRLINLKYFTIHAL